jgi:hypothetical protein
MKGRDQSEDLSVDGRIILEWISSKYAVDWIHLAQNKDQWCAVVNTVINLRVP